MNRYYSHGKLLLTGEYVVLDGAEALALPTQFGQYMTVEKTSTQHIEWISKDTQDNNWFEGSFNLKGNKFVCLSSTDPLIGDRLITLLNSTFQLNPDHLRSRIGSKIVTSLEFPKDWGLGTSSTLINNIALWAEVNPYELLKMTFGGSGYDIACANANGAINFQIINNEPTVTPIIFEPSFKDHLHFVYLNKKQDSREGIARYRKSTSDLSTVIEDINLITDEIAKTSELKPFQQLLDKHEQIIGDCIQLKPIKQRLFPDFKGSIKSLGAWGGDFILAASDDDPKHYFESKGFSTILSYKDMIL